MEMEMLLLGATIQRWMVNVQLGNADLRDPGKMILCVGYFSESAEEELEVERSWQSIKMLYVT